MHKRTKDVVQEISEKYSLSPHVVEKIVSTPWRHMQETIAETPDDLETAAEYPVFYHRHFGVFKVNDRRLNRIRNSDKNKKDGKTRS